MIGLAAVIAALLLQDSREDAARGALPALLSVLPMMLAPGVSMNQFLPPPDRDWLRTAGALALASLPCLGKVARRCPSRVIASLGGAIPGFVLPVLAGYL